MPKYLKNMSTYLGPLDIGTWAHQTKQNRFGKTGGFRETRNLLETLKEFFWGIFARFSRENSFSVSKHLASGTVNPLKTQDDSKTVFQLKEFVQNSFGNS